MEQFRNLQKIFDEGNTQFRYNGLSLFLLSDEQQPYKLYRLNLANNEGIFNIIKDNIMQVPEEAVFFDYPECTSPDGLESVSYIEEADIPDYNLIKDLIANEVAETIDRRGFREIISNIKGYVVKVFYDILDNQGAVLEQKVFLCYSRLTKSCVFEPRHRMFKFAQEDGDILEEVEDAIIKINEKLIAVNTDGYVFIFQGYYFEQLLKYDEHINNQAVTALAGIRTQGLIQNIDILDGYSIENKNVRRKLYKIALGRNIGRITYDKFRELKNKHGENLLYVINTEGTISIQEERVSKSVDHILRIYNDEVAETFITETSIFADKKIQIG